MVKRVWIELDGDLTQTGFRVTLGLQPEPSSPTITRKAYLPAAPELATELQHHWQDNYRELGAPARIKLIEVVHGGLFDRQRQLEKCQDSAKRVKNLLNQWLKSESFRPVYDRLQQELHPKDEIHFLIRSEDSLVKKLPWSVWELFEYYQQAEPAISPLESEPISKDVVTTTDRVRLLVILGHSEGIDVAKDIEILQTLPHVQAKILIEPKRTDISEELWNQPWDIIFFAGHSETENDKGIIYINPNESISIDDLWLGLRQAVNQGLQLAIFNSCDGLGLAKRLDDLNIPQMIVMRELVPDRVAQEFLKYFLAAFAAGQSLYQSVRLARERLDEMEEQFPCASWLPVLCQNPAAEPPRWQDLYRLAEELERPPVAKPQPQPSRRRFDWRRLAVTSLAITAGIMGLRWLGLLEVFELVALDQLMQLRSHESPAAEMLLVEVTPTDTAKYGTRLSDDLLANLIDRLEAYEPAAIALALHRAEPHGDGREFLLQQFEDNENVVTMCSNHPDTDTVHGAPPEFDNDKRQYQVGFSDLFYDRNTMTPTVRRQVFFYTPQRSQQVTVCSTPFSFSFQLAYRFLLQRGITPTATEDRQGWQWGKTTLRPMPSRFGGYQTLGGETLELLIDYRHVEAQPAQSIPLEELLNRDSLSELVRDRIILIGNNNSYLDPTVDTPYGKMPAVWVQAHMTSQLIDIGLGKRVPFWVLSQWQDSLLVWTLGLIGGYLAFQCRSRKLLVLALILTLLLWQQTCLRLLNRQGWLPLIPATLALVITAGVNRRYQSIP